jgi:hypothetical protein
MSCPGQGRDSGTAADLFFYTLFNRPVSRSVQQRGRRRDVAAEQRPVQVACTTGISAAGAL